MNIFRYLKISKLVLLCSLANFINSADRVIMSIAIIQMAPIFKWNLHDQGWILSSFSIGYMSSMVAGGSAAKKYGGKLILILSVFLWSVSTFLTPIFAGNFYLTVFLRVLLGIGEGLGLPTIFHIFSQTVSQEERSTAFGYLIGLGSVGQTVAALLCPHISWQTSFYLFGIFGFVWLILWTIFITSQQSKYNVFEEPDSVAAPYNTPELQLKWTQFVSHWPLWAIYFAHFSMNWSNYIIMHWLPTYLWKYLGANPTQIMFTAFPYILNSVIGIGAGYFADKLIRQHYTILAVRRTMTLIGLIVPGILLLIFSTSININIAIIFVSLSMGFSACNSAGHLSNHPEVAPNHAGITFAVSNTLATIPGILAGPLTAELVTQSSGRWLPVFVLAGLMNIVGALIYITQSSVTPLF